MEADENRTDRARDGIQHLQGAARELIHAAQVQPAIGGIDEQRFVR